MIAAENVCSIQLKIAIDFIDAYNINTLPCNYKLKFFLGGKRGSQYLK